MGGVINVFPLLIEYPATMRPEPQSHEVHVAQLLKSHYVFRSYIGNVPSLIVSDPEMLKQILVKDFSKFTDRAVSF